MPTKKRNSMMAGIPTGNNAALRYQNLSSILNLIYQERPMSRVEISRATGLNKATVSSLVAELVDSGFVKFMGESPSERAGRREVMIDIERFKASIVSVEIGVGFISAILSNFAGEVVWKKEIEFDKYLTPERVATKVVRVAALASLALTQNQFGLLAGIAVAVPGAIDVDSGRVLFAPNLGWRDFPLLSRLKAEFEVPIYIDNEASFAALGEHFFGSARGFSEILYISAGIGIGGGVIAAGNLYRGSGGIAGEFGHMTVDLDGRRCGCGNRGCWETIASEAALFRELDGKSRNNTVNEPGMSDSARLAEVLHGARAGVRRNLKALDVIGRNLAIGIDSLIKIFDPQRIVFGGPLSTLHEFLIPAIESELARSRIFDVSHGVEVVPALFGADASMTGGTAKVIQSILADPYIV